MKFNKISLFDSLVLASNSFCIIADYRMQFIDNNCYSCYSLTIIIVLNFVVAVVLSPVVWHRGPGHLHCPVDSVWDIHQWAIWNDHHSRLQRFGKGSTNVYDILS